MHIIKCRLAIFEKLNGRINHDASKSSSLKFDIYKKNIKTCLCKDIDPGPNFYKN